MTTFEIIIISAIYLFCYGFTFFHFVSSLAMEDEHILSYESEDGRLGFCDHTRKCKNGGFGKSFRHWRIEDKVYKNKEKFIEALADFNPKVINIKDKPYKNIIASMKHERKNKGETIIVDIHNQK